MKTLAKLVAFATVFSAPITIMAHPALAGYSCKGHTATIVGTQGNDTITGRESEGADVIVTLGGDDRIYAGGGDDIVCSQAGDDMVNGMRGKDLIDAGYGNDVVGGGYDSDVLYLGSGSDVYDGDASGSVNHLDTIYGQDGRDKIDTNLDSPMTVYGGKGSDWIRAYSIFSDHIYGGVGVDAINVRDFWYQDGEYLESDRPDTVNAGPEPENTKDSCVVNSNDTVSNCESVETHTDPPF